MWFALHSWIESTDGPIYKWNGYTDIVRTWLIPKSVLYTPTVQKCQKTFNNDENTGLFPDVKHATLISDCIIRNKGGRPNFIGSDAFFVNYVLEEDQKLIPNIDQNRIMVSGSDSTLLNVLNTMATDNESKFTISEMSNAVKKRIHKINLPNCGDLEPLSIKRSRINPDSSSGIVSTLLAGRTRELSLGFSYRIANMLFRKIKRGFLPCINFWKMSTRAKQAKLSWELTDLKSRPVAMCDSVLSMITGVAVQAITDKLVMLPINELFIGRTLSRTEVRWIVEEFGKDEEYKFMYYSPDWSGFDSNVYNDAQIVAMSLLASCFRPTTGSKNYFGYTLTSLIIKYIVLNPGVIYKIDKGIPSGHPFTSLIGTMVNWVIWTTIFDKYCSLDTNCNLDDFGVIVSGDDSTLKVPKNINESLLWDVIQSSGLKCDPIIGTSTALVSNHEHKGAHLLRRHFTSYFSTFWDLEYLTKRLMYHEEKRWDIYDSINQASNYAMSCDEFTDSGRLLANYLRYLYSKLYDENSWKYTEEEVANIAYENGVGKYEAIFIASLKKKHSTYYSTIKHKGNLAYVWELLIKIPRVRIVKYENIVKSIYLDSWWVQSDMYIYKRNKWTNKILHFI